MMTGRTDKLAEQCPISVQVYIYIYNNTNRTDKLAEQCPISVQVYVYIIILRGRIN